MYKKEPRDMSEEELVDQIEETKGIETELKKVLDYKRSLSSEQKLAVEIHDRYCNSNHDDGCGWFDEMTGDIYHNWDGNSHKSCVEIAKSLLDISSFDVIIKILDILPISKRCF